MDRRRKATIVNAFFGECQFKVLQKKKLDKALSSKARLYEGIIFKVLKERLAQKRTQSKQIKVHQSKQFSKVASVMIKMLKADMFNKRLLKDFLEAKNH